MMLCHKNFNLPPKTQQDRRSTKSLPNWPHAQRLKPIKPLSIFLEAHITFFVFISPVNDYIMFILVKIYGYDL